MSDETDLPERWTITASDRTLITKRHSSSRLGFAVLLAFFREHGRFPRAVSETNRMMIEAIARQRLSVRIDVHEAGSPDFHATLTARRVPLTSASLRAALVRYPLMPSRVLGLIHWQALRLWLKRTPFYRKPPHVPGQGSVRP